MSLVNPGLGSALIDCVTTIQGREAEASDNTAEGRIVKLLLCRQIVVVATHLDRGDGTNALDYDHEQRTSSENFYKRTTVGLASYLLMRLHAEPERTWGEVTELEQLVADLTTAEDTSWRREIVTLGEAQGVTVERKQTIAGTASFETPDGTATAYVYQARDPDVELNGVDVYLVELLSEEGAEPTGAYVLMVDDPWWGRRIQPAEFTAAPLTQTFRMGYRLRGRILEDGTPIEDANVSLKLELETVEDGTVEAWDSLEYNELVWDSDLETWVESAQVLAPIMTDADGRWSTIVPRGHGAVYQRSGDLRDETPETAARPLPRRLHRVLCAYRGRVLELTEDQEAVLNIESGRLEISGDPDATVRVATMDDPGEEHTIPSGGTLTVTGLVAGEHSIVAYELTGWGTWDQSYGCARQIAEVTAGETSSVALGPMEYYTDPDMICGRVYERPGVPAAGIEIVVIDTEQYEVLETIATTDGEGYWEAEIPPEGLGGQPAIHDSEWGSMPVLGTPYSDVVLGARVYASAQEEYKPEAWRRPLRGHKNFQYCPGSVIVTESDGGASYATEEVPYGGWATAKTLPKFKYVPDIEELVVEGPQMREYDIVVDGVVEDAGLTLRGQPFDDTGSGAGEYRAAGYYPEQKLLLGGKVHGNVLRDADEAVDEELPEAARVGLEFGTHQAFVEARALEGPEIVAGIADTVCPYCGGPAWRGPSSGYLRGYCMQCANAFGRPDAMDCRGYFETPTVHAAEGYELRLVRLCEREGSWSRRVRSHWRPDLYAETDDFVTQSGRGQTTNAPRWVAKHVDEMGDGLGFGGFDGDAQDPYVEGHDLSYYEGLLEIDRALGVAALKLVFPSGHVSPQSYTVEIDCVRSDSEVETRTVTILEGTSGPTAEDEFGDVVPVVSGNALVAEDAGSPYAGVGLYRGISDIRLVEPQSAPGCQFTVVNDVPLLASCDGVEVQREAATPVAARIGGRWGQPHLFDDAVGQLFLLHVRDGDIYMQRRAGLPGSWTDPVRITEGGDGGEPWAEKDEHGHLIVVYTAGGGRATLLRSMDDGRTWEEVG